MSASTAILLLRLTLVAGAGDASSPPASRLDLVAPMLLVVGVLIIAIFLVRSARMRIARRRAETPSPREQIERIHGAASSRDDLHALHAEVLDTVQRLSAQLDAKAERLEQLLAEADERVARLAGRAPEPRSGARAAGAEAEAEALDAGEEIAPDPLTAAVYELADAGHDPVEIARELDEQIGKVELILALRPVDT